MPLFSEIFQIKNDHLNYVFLLKRSNNNKRVFHVDFNVPFSVNVIDCIIINDSNVCNINDKKIYCEPSILKDGLFKLTDLAINININKPQTYIGYLLYLNNYFLNDKYYLKKYDEIIFFSEHQQVCSPLSLKLIEIKIIVIANNK